MDILSNISKVIGCNFPLPESPVSLYDGGSAQYCNQFVIHETSKMVKIIGSTHSMGCFCMIFPCSWHYLITIVMGSLAKHLLKVELLFGLHRIYSSLWTYRQMYMYIDQGVHLMSTTKVTEVIKWMNSCVQCSMCEFVIISHIPQVSHFVLQTCPNLACTDW